MRSMSKSLLRRNRETLIYVALWVILFGAPVLSMYLRVSGHSEAVFQWDEVTRVWKILLLYLVAFLLHNSILAPLLIYRKRRALYLLTTACLVGAVVVMSCASRPAPDKRPRPVEGIAEPSVYIGHVDLVNAFVITLLIGMNLGVKLYFKSETDQEKVQDLESQHLEGQLAYLKFQINPHFFMNTLNNIHALVDIDPERAKDTIVKLSRFMRFVLYESDKQVVPLSREINFIQLYVDLMRMRYTDKVSIRADIPSDLPDCDVPPLVFVTFVENAFKHGVSYERDSYVHFSISSVDGLCRFVCQNSKQPQASQQTGRGGIGLRNVQERLRLIYAEDCHLDIRNDDNSYRVELTLPVTHHS